MKAISAISYSSVELQESAGLASGCCTNADYARFESYIVGAAIGAETISQDTVSPEAALGLATSTLSPTTPTNDELSPGALSLPSKPSRHQPAHTFSYSLLPPTCDFLEQGFAAICYHRHTSRRPRAVETSLPAHRPRYHTSLHL
jgi:hypothetical protein